MKLVCCNPLKKHSRKTTGLQKVYKWMIGVNQIIKASSRVCTSCRFALFQLKKENNLPFTQSVVADEVDMVAEVEQGESFSEDEAVIRNEIVSKMNETLNFVDQSPISTKKLSCKKYSRYKSQKVCSSIRRKIFTGTSPSKIHQCPESEIINQLKEKFEKLTKASEKIQLLTVLPKSWPIRKMIKEFKITYNMARKVKMLVDEKGVLSTPNQKLGKALPTEFADIVKKYYECDDISRCMPGIKDFVSVTENGIKIHKTKRLLLGNLREVYAMFQEKHGQHKIGLSKFCELRPKNVVLADACGAHNVCVCTKHQNVKLMIHAINLKKKLIT